LDHTSFKTPAKKSVLSGILPRKNLPLDPGENLGELPSRIPPRFCLQGISLPSDYLTGISLGFPPRMKILVSKILPGSCQYTSPYSTRKGIMTTNLARCA